jgi:4-diphosphocytidyl-2-C-methyl-D-erythritol kinase
MIVFPKAKINLGLRITGKRPDGYHNIETHFFPVNLCDALEFVISYDQNTKDILTVTGFRTGGLTEDNLVLKTVRKLRERYSFPFLKIHLHKAIPIGAGLGGGSSDAACMLKVLNRCFRLKIEELDLNAMALQLGSDCPFFIDCKPSFASGRGEILKPINPVLKDYYLILLNPGVEINTKEAYQNCQPLSESTNLYSLIDQPVTKWKNLIINDFENFAFKKHPRIGEIKQELYRSGAIFSSMSGSGSSVYGIFTGKPELSDQLKANVIFEGLM